MGTDKILEGLTHYASGRKHAELFSTPQAMNDPIPDSFIYVEYFDENFNCAGLSRVFKRQRTDASFELLEYHEGTDQIKRVERFNPDGVLTEVLEFEAASGSASLRVPVLTPSENVLANQSPDSVSSERLRTPLFWSALATRSEKSEANRTEDEWLNTFFRSRQTISKSARTPGVRKRRIAG